MNDYPVVITEEKEDERLSVYCNYKADISYILLRAVGLLLFGFFSVKLFSRVFMHTPYLSHNFSQIIAKYEYIKEGVPVAYMMQSVDFIFGLAVDYIFLALCIINVIWCAIGIVFKLRFAVRRKQDAVTPGANRFVFIKRRLSLFFLRWNIVSFIVVVILYVSKKIIF